MLTRITLKLVLQKHSPVNKRGCYCRDLASVQDSRRQRPFFHHQARVVRRDRGTVAIEGVIVTPDVSPVFPGVTSPPALATVDEDILERSRTAGGFEAALDCLALSQALRPLHLAVAPGLPSVQPFLAGKRQSTTAVEARAFGVLGGPYAFVFNSGHNCATVCLLLASFSFFFLFDGEISRIASERNTVFRSRCTRTSI